MKAICLDPVTPPLLIAGHLSFVTVDHPPPDWCTCDADWGGDHTNACTSGRRWIGQRVAIYATDDSCSDCRGTGCGNEVDGERVYCGIVGPCPDPCPVACSVCKGRGIVGDAIVGSGTLAEAPLLITAYGHDVQGDQVTHRLGKLLWYSGDTERNISDQLPLQDWSPGRWALRFTDVAPTSERCPTCGLLFGAWLENYCPTCGGAGAVAPIPAPVLLGDDPTYKEWTP